LGLNLTLILIFFLPPILFISFLCFYRQARLRGKGGPLRLLLGNLLLLAFLTSLLLAGGEAYYRFLCDETDGFAVGLVSERWFARHYTFNNRGVRDNVDYASLPAGDKGRITFLGDSNTNGHGLPRVEERFVNILREDLTAWEIHYLGGDGNDTGHLLGGLRRWIGEGYQIDIVVYVYCLNDISDLMSEWRETSSRLYFERPGFPFANSYFLNTLYYRFKVLADPELRAYFDNVAAAYEDARWPLQQQRLELLHEIVTSNGAELLVVTFPFLEHMRSPAFLAIHRKLADFWRRKGVPHLDLIDTYRGIPIEALRVNAHDSHPNARGHSLAASSIGRFLDEQLPEPGESDDER
jgi:hypothetical protein